MSQLSVTAVSSSTFSQNESRCVSADEARQKRIESYLKEGNEAQLDRELSALNDEEFNRAVTRQIFEKLPPALFTSNQLHPRLQKLIEKGYPPSAAQQSILDNPGRCLFHGKVNLSLGKPSPHLKAMIKNMTSAHLKNSYFTLPAPYLILSELPQRADLTEPQRGELQRYSRECRSEAV
ncbi:MAG: hypothetical protein C5B47_02950 [Verrucomicrobia bacterium]|nr:MAG: hypothetical protein C5B47_02950 [Verrucomicrobiota bacterium]